jgi:predicted kinase
MGAVTHLILMCGLPGSGKTTRALALAANLPALRICPDDWMEALGFHLDDEQARDRLELMQWDQAQQLLMLGANVIIENGFWGRSQRDEARLRARELGVAVHLDYEPTRMDELWARLQRRNAEQPQKRVRVTFEQLVEWEGYFQPPDEDELALFDPLSALLEEDA